MLNVMASHPHIQGDDFRVVMLAGYIITFVLNACSLSLRTTLVRILSVVWPRSTWAWVNRKNGPSVLVHPSGLTWYVLMKMCLDVGIDGSWCSIPTSHSCNLQSCHSPQLSWCKFGWNQKMMFCFLWLTILVEGRDLSRSSCTGCLMMKLMLTQPSSKKSNVWCWPKNHH
jgi:hypothetical protein